MRKQKIYSNYRVYYDYRTFLNKIKKKIPKKFMNNY